MPCVNGLGMPLAEAMAKLLRENQELTQDLEFNKEDIVMYEQVARDVETKWMLSKEVISDLRSQMIQLMATYKTMEKEVEAKKDAGECPSAA
mmetsp:Transcript_26270/g.38611  ORF Transcript_26270/g.38611 Transcript_26270/m.38611 type:complete len:92 (-) Transcript_26270:268-543(-)